MTRPQPGLLRVTALCGVAVYALLIVSAPPVPEHDKVPVTDLYEMER